MIIVEPNVSLCWATPDIELTIAQSGRTCYKSEVVDTLESAQAFCRKRLREGHTSIFEHASISVHIVCDRGVSHELVRHRIGVAFSQESTRYCNYGRKGAISVIRPPLLQSADAGEAWRVAVNQAEASYLQMLDYGITPQIARSVLPNCLKTEVRTTFTVQAWRHFFSLRLSPKAHPQMREIAALALLVAKPLAPVIFEEFDGGDLA